MGKNQKLAPTICSSAAEYLTLNDLLKKIFSDSELEGDSVIRDFRITAKDDKTYNTKHYNLIVQDRLHKSDFDKQLMELDPSKRSEQSTGGDDE